MALGAKKTGAPSGLSAMAKMFGIDPAKIMETGRAVEADVKRMADAMEQMNRKLDRIAKKLGIEDEEDGRELSIVASAGAGKNGR